MERKLTQDQVVSKLQLMDLDITRSIYSQIEGGTYSIRISVLAGLAQIFQVDYNTFFRDVHLPGFGIILLSKSSHFLFVLTVAHILTRFRTKLARFCDCAVNFPMLQ